MNVHGYRAGMPPLHPRKAGVKFTHSIRITELLGPSPVSMENSHNKGFLLEAVVIEIEKFILRHALKQSTFEVEQKKTICVDGVHHEVDAYVTINAADGYRAIYIFECKNWRRPVGKNEIVDFSEKIKAAGAAEGQFVAKSFTADARAQAKKDARLGLLVVKEHSPSRVKTPPSYQFAYTQWMFDYKTSASGKWESEGGGDCQPVTPKNTIKVEGKPLLLRDYLFGSAEEYLDDLCDAGAFANLHEGPYDCTVIFERTFKKGQLRRRGRDIKMIKLTVDFTMNVFRNVFAHFEVATRGSILLFAPTSVFGLVQQMAIVSRKPFSANVKS